MVLSREEIYRLGGNYIRMTADAVSLIYLASTSGSQNTKGLMPNLTVKRRWAMHDLRKGGLMPNLGEGDLISNLNNPITSEYFYLSPHNEGQIGNASFDFRVGHLVVRADFVDERIRMRDLEKMPHKVLNPGEKFVFEADADGNNVYYVSSFEDVDFSNGLDVEVHAKSTSGRVGCHVGGYVDKDARKIIMILQPVSFNLIATCGTTQFGQGVVRYAGTPLPTRDEILKGNLVRIHNNGKLEDRLTHRGFEMHFNTSCAYRAKKTNEAIDMDARNLDGENWWDFIEGTSDLTLDAKRLYLLGSLGGIGMGNACGILSKEQRTFNGRGGFGCLAGVIQPGFCGEITMEPLFPNKTRIHNGDTAGIVMIDTVEGMEGDKSYGGDYQGQKAPRLPKMFKEHRFS